MTWIELAPRLRWWGCMTIRHARAVAAVAVAVVAIASCIDPLHSCPACPATAADLSLVVRNSAGSGVVNDVAVTIVGQQNATMSCAPNQGATECRWPSVPVTAGTYSLQVAAPGFQSTQLSATVTITPDPTCGCTSATLDPSEIELDPISP